MLSWRSDDPSKKVQVFVSVIKRLSQRRAFFFDFEYFDEGGSDLNHITYLVENSRVYIPIISPYWLDEFVNNLDDPNDYIVHGVQVASKFIERGEMAIHPVYIDCNPPNKDELPSELQMIVDILGHTFDIDIDNQELVDEHALNFIKTIEQRYPMIDPSLLTRMDDLMQLHEQAEKNRQLEVKIVVLSKQNDNRYYRAVLDDNARRSSPVDKQLTEAHLFTTSGFHKLKIIVEKKPHLVSNTIEFQVDADTMASDEIILFEFETKTSFGRLIDIDLKKIGITKGNDM